MLKLHDAYTQTVINIVDVTGRSIRHIRPGQGVTDIVINTTDLSAGTYSLIIHSATSQITLPFVKE